MISNPKPYFKLFRVVGSAGLPLCAQACMQKNSHDDLGIIGCACVSAYVVACRSLQATQDAGNPWS